MAPYTEESLAGLKKCELADRIRKQLDCWPSGSFNESKTTIKAMKAALLNCANGFSDSDVLPLTTEGSPLTPLSATSSASTPPPPPQSDVVDASSRLGPPDNHGIDMQRDPESTKGLTVISLFLQDRRFNPMQKSVVRLCVDVNGKEGLEGEGQISAREVICHLQRSHSALHGPARLGTPYHPDPAYIEYFAQFADANNLEDCKIHPEMLSIASSKLEIIIEDVIGSHTFGPHTLSGPTSVEGGSGTRNAEPSRREAKPSKSEGVIAWLREKALAHEGYSLFIGSRHRAVQNSEIAAIWKFISNFYKIYFNAKNPISQTPVKKKALYAALDVHETWFNDALNGNRLVEIYGRGGPHEDPSVVSELTAIRNPPRGRSVLLKFLHDWEVNHPSIPS